MATLRKVKKSKPAVKAVPTRPTKVSARKTITKSTGTVSLKRVVATNGSQNGSRNGKPNGKPIGKSNGKLIGRSNGKSNGKHASPLVVKSPLNQKETLQQERVQVENELARLRAELQQAPEMTGDEVDLNVYERERTLGLVATYERRLDEIDATLKVAAQGKYGICERCGKPIPPERLQIFPETRVCVSCKNELEKEQRRLRL